MIPNGILANCLRMCPRLERLNLEVLGPTAEQGCLQATRSRKLKHLVLRVQGEVDIGVLESQVCRLTNVQHVRIELDHEEATSVDMDRHLRHLKLLALPFRQVYVEYVRAEASTYSARIVRISRY